MVTGDGRMGYPECGPYDCIHVGAAAPKMPEELIKQLAPGGVMVIPVGVHEQEFLRVTKDATGKINTTRVFGVRYVPLTSKEEQLKRH